MSNQLPALRSKVLVYVHSSPIVSVRSSARFQTATEIRHAVADQYGNATLVYSVKRARKGYTVRVTVTVSKGGSRAMCRTEFTPK